MCNTVKGDVVYGPENNAEGKFTSVAREIDFIAYSGGKKTYIQSRAFACNREKTLAENKPFKAGLNSSVAVTAHA